MPVPVLTLVHCSLDHVSHLASARMAQGFPDCKTVSYRCSPDTTDDIIYAFLITSLFVYFISTGFYLRRSFVYLRTKPYNQMRMANQHLRINVRTVRMSGHLNRDHGIPCCRCSTNYDLCVNVGCAALHPCTVEPSPVQLSQ